jgi:prepilin-type processing-associated H-X9-DG protein
MYIQDYDEVLPFANDFGKPLYNFPGSPIQGRYKYWADALAPYIKNGGHSGISAGGTGNYGPAQRCPNRADWYTGFAYNINLGYYPGDQLSPVRTGPLYQGVALAAINRPSDLIALLENSVPYAWMRNNLNYSHGSAYGLAYRWFPQAMQTCLTWYNWPDSAKLAGIAGQGEVSGRHNLGANCAFADGHSKWLKTGNPICLLERGFPDAP